MPGVIAGNPPGIFTPGSGPNGPGPVDARMPETSVGFKSSVPYGPSWNTGPYVVYATPGGVTGFVGPPAWALRLPVTWYVRTSGNNNNGGTSASPTPERSGADGVGNNTTTFTSSGAAFTSADVNKGICVQTGSSARRCKIVSVTNSTTVILDQIPGNASGLAWAIGGAWADLRPAFGDTTISALSNSAVVPGDTVYVGAGIYRVIVSGGVALNWYNNYNGYVDIVGDVDGSKTGDAGEVRFTNYLTSDKVAATGSSMLNFGNNGRNIKFRKLMFVAGGGNTPLVSATTTQNIHVIDCGFISVGSSSANVLAFTVGAHSNAQGGIYQNSVIGAIVIDRIHAKAAQLSFGTQGSSPLGIWILNSLLDTGNGGAIGINLNSSVAGADGNGFMIRGNFFMGNFTNGAFRLNSAGTSSTRWISQVIGNIIFNGGLAATTLGQMVEDYNIITGGRTNVNAGAHSISDQSYSTPFHFGQERIWGGLPRLYGEPMAGSAAIAFGDDGSHMSYDILSRPRPAGGGSPLVTLGAFERGNTAVQGTSPVPPSGSNVWQLVGPGSQDFLLPVSAVASGFSIYVQRDGNYSSPVLGNPAILLNPDLTLDGVAQQAVVDTGAANTWNLLSFASFTPGQVGWVKIRLVSYDATGTSVVSFAVAAPTP